MHKQGFVFLFLAGFAMGVVMPRRTFAATSSASLTEASDTEEVGYDELVRRLSDKAKRPASSVVTKSDFDRLKMYADFSFVSSYNATSINGNSDMSTTNGFQLGAGIDLFSSEWMGKGLFRNFGEASSGARTRSEREFDLEAVYHEKNFHLALGLGTRYLRVSDSKSAVNVDDSTPVSVFAAGVDLPINETIAMVIEMGWRSAIVTSTSDKNSLDATFGLSAQF